MSPEIFKTHTHISPAILTDDPQEFQRQFQRCLDFGFTMVDIDAVSDRFVGGHTLRVAEMMELVPTGQEVSIGWHLMVTEPGDEVGKLVAKYEHDPNLRIYIHQEANISFIESGPYPQDIVRVAVLLESELKDLEFYLPFPEVQLMSIEAGKQGNEFQPRVLEKVKQLRKLGYRGHISLDGGINLNTAPMVACYDLYRISVGSYFARSEDLETDWHALQMALNCEGPEDNAQEEDNYKT